ncbi:DUF427 domain-containing protein [Actinomycetospora sp.]|uniref:DUF427 domain-containing protein n=1 Tax=Actinomycetospora sp. TaxID=1872135 RepID=UPI0039C85A18
MTVTVSGRTIVDTTNAVILQEAGYPAVYYVPLAEVDPDVLRPSDHETYCPFKGEASYYSVATDDGELADVVWTYRKPYDAVAQIKDHVAFYANRVDISVG